MSSHEWMELDVAAKEEDLLVVRLAASGAASLCGFATETMEDIAAAVHEMCFFLLRQKQEHKRLKLRFEWEDSMLRIRCQARERGMLRSGQAPAPELCASVLKVLMDEVGMEMDEEENICAITLAKRA